MKIRGILYGVDMTLLQDVQVSQASEIVRELKRNPSQSANKVSDWEVDTIIGKLYQRAISSLLCLLINSLLWV
ncbi:hypothetical protein N9Y17_00990 [Gammaproteobacteria bacterium]|nr:hypothetical protein [Gammaproteobacteria bacterium]